MELPEGTSSDSLSEQEWVIELQKLARDIGEKEIYVLIQSPFFHLVSSAFQPEVREQKIDVLLQPQLPSGLASGGLGFFLPKEDDPFSVYSKKVSDEGIVLSVSGPICHLHRAVGFVEIHFATSQEALNSIVNPPLIQ